ncbi:hypothetical protein HYX09_03030 [Candidatus Woesearchaeota archaeon]|nr:hypothetical protein [Candidatus Woesearchaeota archaeon]
MILYITHCTYQKDDSLKNKDIETTPDKLYTGTKIQRFIKQCKETGVKWAIFSDYYNVWFSDVKHKWYEKHPKEVTSEEFNQLVENSVKKLSKFDKIFFYANYKSRYFHDIYKRLINELEQKGINIMLISHLSDIKNENPK